jgi:hypothetical protein
VLRYLKIVKWRANKQLQQQQKNWQPHKIRLHERVKTVWFNLNTAQKLYLIALMVLLVFQSGWLCALITITALVIEFWPKFNKLWHSLAGKALILIFYASIANFVLANASGIVNDVTHVSATQFNYTHNFATLLYLPPWALGITLSTLLLFQLILPFYIIALLLLKPFGSERVKFISQSYSPLITATLRFFLSLVVLSALFTIIDGRDEETFLADIQSGYYFGQEMSNDSSINKEKALVDLKVQLEKPDSSVDADIKSPDTQIEEITKATESANLFLNTQGYFERSKRLIALFAFNYEADGFSRCKKAKNSKSIEINDYEIVEITPDNTMPYGYKFIVKACESPAFKAPN